MPITADELHLYKSYISKVSTPQRVVSEALLRHTLREPHRSKDWLTESSRKSSTGCTQAQSAGRGSRRSARRSACASPAPLSSALHAAARSGLRTASGLYDIRYLLYDVCYLTKQVAYVVLVYHYSDTKQSNEYDV